MLTRTSLRIRGSLEGKVARKDHWQSCVSAAQRDKSDPNLGVITGSKKQRQGNVLIVA